MTTSCNQLLITPANTNISPYVVTRIYGTSSKSICTYEATTSIDHLRFVDDIRFEDTIGKFQVGDTLRVKMVIDKNNTVYGQSSHNGSTIK